jgi:hypothetical protein
LFSKNQNFAKARQKWLAVNTANKGEKTGSGNGRKSSKIFYDAIYFTPGLFLITVYYCSQRKSTTSNSTTSGEQHPEWSEKDDYFYHFKFTLFEMKNTQIHGKPH